MGSRLSQQAGRYAHARQFKRMRRIIRQRRTIAGRQLRCNFLKGTRGDAMSLILAAAGFNLRLLMRWIIIFWRWLWAVIISLLGRTHIGARPAMVLATV